MDLKKKGFQLPEKIRFEEETLTDTYGTMIAEPLERGFGITLGNSLRRILLSSIEGAAATGIMIRGAQHEFATLEGVKEDVVDVILNIKELKFSMESTGQKTAIVKATGPQEITGGDRHIISHVGRSTELNIHDRDNPFEARDLRRDNAGRLGVGLRCDVVDISQ